MSTATFVGLLLIVMPVASTSRSAVLAVRVDHPDT
jgi:hypothetical protein